MLDHCLFGWDADDIAARIGVEILAPHGFGSTGSVYMLEDGRVLKLATSRDEAAVAVFLMEELPGDLPLPAVDAVFRHEAGDDSCWAILREEAADLWPDPTPSETWRMLEWDGLVRKCGAGRDLSRLEASIGDWDHFGTELRELAAGLRRLETRSSIILFDLWCENAGRGQDGRVVLRDFSHAAWIPERIRVLAGMVPALPERLPTGPGPV